MYEIKSIDSLNNYDLYQNYLQFLESGFIKHPFQQRCEDYALELFNIQSNKDSVFYAEFKKLEKNFCISVDIIREISGVIVDNIKFTVDQYNSFESFLLEYTKKVEYKKELERKSEEFNELLELERLAKKYGKNIT